MNVIVSGRLRRRTIIICLQLKERLGGHSFKDDREVETAVMRWLMTQYTDWYQQRIEKLALRRPKSLSCSGDYSYM